MPSSMTEGTRTRRWSRSPTGLTNPCRTISCGMSCAAAGPSVAARRTTSRTRKLRISCLDCNEGRRAFKHTPAAAVLARRSIAIVVVAVVGFPEDELLRALARVDLSGVEVAARVRCHVVHPVELAGAAAVAAELADDLAGAAQQRRDV